MNSCPVSNPKTPASGGLRRWLLAALGVICVGLAAIGVFLPGLPTTVFLIAASVLFTKSCPWLEAKLIRVKLFRPYLRYIDGEVDMSPRAKASAIALKWAAVAVSAVVLWLGGVAPWIVGSLVAAGAVGTVVILRLRPSRRPSSPAPARSR